VTPLTAPRLFEPHAGLILQRLAAHIDEGMLWDIAKADYGQQAKEHHAVLRRMRDEGFVPPSEWVPQEVLELVRWSQPDERGWMPGGQGARGHWMRAFCCASLLRMAGERNIDAHFGFGETLAGLIASLAALDTDLWAETGALLTWFIERLATARGREDEPFVGVGLLYCAAHIATVEDASIVMLCRWIIAREEEEAYGPMGAANDDGWLCRVTGHNQRRAIWKALGRKMADMDLSPRSLDTRDWVALIATSLAE
jgi:hypothetical protein